MLRIGFDGACLSDGPITGVARSFLDGLAAYAARGDADCVLLVPDGANAPTIPGVRAVHAPRGALRRQLGLPRLLRALRADLLHSSVASVPLCAPCPMVATVHDLPWFHPEAEERTSARRRFATRTALRAARAIVVPSRSTADDVTRLLGAGHPEIHLVPHGTALGPPPTDGAVDARQGPLLVLGDDRPRKNRARLVAAHALARREHGPTLPPLAFVGPPHAYVDEQEKRRLLSTCRALVHVSLFEGFGLPVLEGLAHGAPVVCSDLLPHREIAGDAALYADPRDEAAIAGALVAIASDEALRRRLAREGHERAAAFSLEATAAGWRSVHERIVR